jgi:hypothetical protein
MDDFLHPSPTLAGVEVELRERLARDVRRRDARAARPRRRWRPRPVSLTLAAAAVVILAALWWRPFESAEQGTLRSTTAERLSQLRLDESSLWSGDSVELRWNRIDAAERYEVVLELAGESSLWVRVRALRAARVLEDSGLQPLTNRR